MDEDALQFIYQDSDFLTRTSSSPDVYDSPLEVSSSPNPFDSEVIEAGVLRLLHKPRGSKGLWQPVESGDKLRVTKGKGKRLKLQIQLPEGFKYDDSDKNNIQLQLIEMESNNSTSPKDPQDAEFVIETIKIHDSLVDIDIKLLKMARKLQFVLHLKGNLGQIVESKSVEFASHNSGAVSAPRSKDPNDHINSENLASLPDGHPKKRRISPGTMAPLCTDASSIPQSNPSLVQTSSNGNSATPSIHAQPLSNNTPNTWDQFPVQTGELHSVTLVPGSLDVHGSVRAFGFFQFSDRSLKENFRDIVDAIDIVTKLQGQTYEWKQGTELSAASGGKRVIGLIAQDVQKVLPEVVHEDKETGLLKVNYSEILPVLIEAFKQMITEQQNTKKEINSEIQQLQSKLHQMSQQFEEHKQIRSQEQAKLLDEIVALSQTIKQEKTYPMVSIDVEQVDDEPTTKRHPALARFLSLGKKGFIALFTTALILTIIGIALIASFVPEDSSATTSTKSLPPSMVSQLEGLWKAGNASGNGNASGASGNGTSSSQATGNGGNSNQTTTTQTSTPAPTTTEEASIPSPFIVGIVLVALGFAGMSVSGFGLAVLFLT